MKRTAQNLVDLLAAHSLVCATAESCTGGGVAAAITGVPGSSAVFAGGVVSYANEAKRDVLGVKAETLAEYGAVSAQTAAQMAQGVLSLMKCDLAVSLTGIAGPGGGSAEKPVGLVWFGIADGGGVRTEKAIFPGDREEVRRRAVVHALGMLTVAALGGGR
jgi:nicotinamide-nucleotide amidase